MTPLVHPNDAWISGMISNGADMAETLYLKQIECGPMQNYVYLIGDPVTRQAAAVDPAWEINRIVQTAQEDDYTISKVLITHTHQDHTGGEMFGHHIPGLVELLELLDVPVYVHRTETHILKSIPDSSKVGTESNQVVDLGGDVEITLVHTPGHTPGSQCFLVQNRLVSGDTLFIGACGRVDLPNSSPEDMHDSLTNKLIRLDDNTILYSGHNYAAQPTSTIGEQRRTNPYCQPVPLQQFLRMMGH